MTGFLAGARPVAEADGQKRDADLEKLVYLPQLQVMVDKLSVSAAKVIELINRIEVSFPSQPD